MTRVKGWRRFFLQIFSFSLSVRSLEISIPVQIKSDKAFPSIVFSTKARAALSACSRFYDNLDDRAMNCSLEVAISVSGRARTARVGVEGVVGMRVCVVKVRIPAPVGGLLPPTKVKLNHGTAE